jgi:hypothetical protein
MTYPATVTAALWCPNDSRPAYSLTGKCWECMNADVDERRIRCDMMAEAAVLMDELDVDRPAILRRLRTYCGWTE